VRTAVILALLIAGSTIAQTGKVTSGNVTGQIWEIPFASIDNAISLHKIDSQTDVKMGNTITTTGDDVTGYALFCPAGSEV
jgi:hypothetical protein